MSQYVHWAHILSVQWMEREGLAMGRATYYQHPSLSHIQSHVFISFMNFSQVHTRKIRHTKKQTPDIACVQGTT